MDTRETTVLFAAAIGGADLYAKAGDVAAADALARCMDVLGEASSKAGARVVKRTPDKLMALAADADIAVEAAAAMHQAMIERPPLAGVRLALGVAFHHGPVIQKDADVFGDTVNLAARLVELAGRGQIITTRETARGLGGLYRPWIRDLYATDIKGRSEKVELVELVWQSDPDETATTLTVPTKKLGPAAGALVLVYRGAKVVRRRQRDSITLGRDEQCGLVVHADDASRLHCTIERKHDKFVLVDHSTNGTYVTIEGSQELRVQREEFVLTRRGTIALGRPKAATQEIVEFTVE
ncbi:MAG TPA: adenylate/guanylate cyclase domain-containing protein [Burkholderiales bacterium]|nr:adenylate/guanylate cyclase domain-containing protein [Burkholderiales bacterium]